MSARELQPLPRLALLAAAFGCLTLASPGVAFPEGSALLALAALVLWGHGASRPGRAAFWIECLLGALAWSWICSWAALVWPGTLLVIGPGKGLYMALAGVVLRRLAPRFPMALALPAAWMGVDTLRSVAPPPVGMSWMRMGTHLADVPALLGSARLWGFVGLGWVLCALAGGLLDLLRRERPRGVVLALGLGPLVAAAALTQLLRAPASEPGPTLLLVQPNIPQERKMSAGSASSLFGLSLELTRAGLAAGRAQGLGEPDLVCWGETMLPTPVIDPGLADAVRAGASLPPWYDLEWGLDDVERLSAAQRDWVEGRILGHGRRGVLGEGTSFLAGAEHLRARDGQVRRGNSIVLWDPQGHPSGPIDKLVRVPGTETMLGLERFAWVREVILDLAGYLPDLDSDLERPRTLELHTRAGQSYRLGLSVCFDNAFDEPFVRPLREGPVDFHLVASNEAWFRESLEFDQMVAFSRVEAAATGRSVVRVTNSGISCLIGPDGRVLERLVVGGRDRAVQGTLRVTVPVPAGAAAARTAFVRSGRLWSLAALLLPLGLLLLSRRSSGPGRPPPAA